MEFFRDFRLSRGRSVLRRKLTRAKRIKFSGNINTAKKIAVVWDASDPSDFPTLSQFHQKMLDRNLDLSIIAYYPGKELPDKITAIRYLTCLKQQDTNFFYRPVSTEAGKFINTRFDILIDANFKNLFPLEYISSLSSAGFKVGIFDNGYENSPFDLMLEYRKGTDLNNFLIQALHYLEMINTGTKQKSE